MIRFRTPRFLHPGSGVVFAEKYPSIRVYEIIRNSLILDPDRDLGTLSENDLILVRGSASDLVGLLSEGTVQLPHADPELGFGAAANKSFIVELIVPPQSSLLGESLLESELLKDPNIHVIAVKRRWIHYSEQKIRSLKLGIGDILLIRCSEEKLEEIRKKPDFIIVEDVHHEIVLKAKARIALLIFAGIIVTASAGILDLMACALGGVFLMIVTGCLSLRGVYRNIQGNLLTLIAGAIALGSAMEKSGAAKLYANAFLSLFQGAGPGLVTAGILLLTIIVTEFLTNNAAAVLILPIAIATATNLGVNPKPFIIAVCFGASLAFAMPIGYQTNLLVFGPGRYRFLDFFKMGIFLDLIVFTLGSVFIPMIWPF